MSNEEYLIEELVSAYNRNLEVMALLQREGCEEAAKPYWYTATTIRFIMENVLGSGELHYRTIEKTCCAGNYTIDQMEVP